ncbi:hypothetical protein PVAND_002868 [Polypedilum vanderplanki]|uniref:Cilia- and flagella-associated protein 126 n=1 Tax=Polypedilum vanderplanki TaxID=319348 RepID=A0A9J6BT54_POLVA|nr:hypothetical protein PVAND_002868 [Polypedilum vanderplanki]
MAANFSANQYEDSFKAKSLCNWEVPHWYPSHPQRRTKTTKFIANDRGHLLENVERPKSSPWGHFKSTWQLPNIITRQYANELSAPQVGNSRWTIPDPNRKIMAKVKNIKQESVGEDKSIGVEVSEIIRSITPFEKEESNESPTKVLNEKEKLNDPIAIAKGGSRTIRHETLERDNDLH